MSKLVLTTTEFRAAEALSIDRDLDFEHDPAKAFVRGEYTKTKTDRYVFLTNEVVQQLKIWLEYKYRKLKYVSILSIILILMSSTPLISGPSAMNYANDRYATDTQTQSNANDCDNGTNCAINSPQIQGDDLHHSLPLFETEEKTNNLGF